MMPRGVPPTLAVALLLVPALAGASWSVEGDVEPDTPFDRSAGMWTKAPQDASARDRVYFDVVAGMTSTHVYNANVARLGGRLAPPEPRYAAVLGVWLDCNTDGYVGTAEGALWAYRVEALPDASLCDAVPGHVYDGWVHEMRLLGRRDLSPDRRTPGMIIDRDLRIWGDEAAPGAWFGPTCAERPLPEGTTSSTGGLLAYLDCRGNRGLARTVNAIDEDGSLGLRFADPSRPDDAGSALHHELPAHPWRSPDGNTGLLDANSGDPAYRVWDCDAPRALVVVDPTRTDSNAGLLATTAVGGRRLADPQGRVLVVAQPAPSLRDPTASHHDSLVNVLQGAMLANQTGGCAYRGDSTGPRELAQQREYGDAGAIARPHRWVDHTFTYYTGARVNLSMAGFGDEQLRPPGAPGDYGVAPTGRTICCVWLSRRMVEDTDPAYVDRTTLAVRGARYASFYVALRDTATLLALPPGGVYGAEWCGLDSTDIVRGFDCDKTRWWREDHGAPPPPPSGWGDPVRPGTSYHLRDVDCFDDSIARDTRLGVSDGTAEGPCPST